MMKYYAEDKSVVKDLKYYARYDPSGDVRKVAINSLADSSLVKLTFFYDHAFDPEESVRIEAFSVLSKKPYQGLNAEKRLKLLYWGLSGGRKFVTVFISVTLTLVCYEHNEKAVFIFLVTAERMKKCIKTKLIPAWLEECNGDPVLLLRTLDATDKLEVVALILNNIYQ
jgi:hypothetical protein